VTAVALACASEPSRTAPASNPRSHNAHLERSHFAFPIADEPLVWEALRPLSLDLGSVFMELGLKTLLLAAVPSLSHRHSTCGRGPSVCIATRRPNFIVLKGSAVPRPPSRRGVARAAARVRSRPMRPEPFHPGCAVPAGSAGPGGKRPARLSMAALALGVLAACGLLTPDRALRASELPAGQRECPGGAAGEVLQRVNRERRRAGAAPLVAEARLGALARGRASGIAGRRRLSHAGWQGALRVAGVTADTLGENVAVGQSSARAVVATWLASRGHRANLLARDFRRSGVGCVVDAHGRRWWAQIFAGR